MSRGRFRLSGLDPSIREAARWTVAVADYYGVPVNVISGRRSFEEQARLREAWERGLQRYPANRPGESAHNYGLAFDAQVPPAYQAFWDYVRRYAGFHTLPNDPPHAELPEWRSYV